jgi:hypothetical protein
MDGDAREVMGKQTLPARLDLNELHGSIAAGDMQSEGVATDVAEKIEDIHLYLFNSLG